MSAATLPAVSRVQRLAKAGLRVWSRLVRRLLPRQGDSPALRLAGVPLGHQVGAEQ